MRKWFIRETDPTREFYIWRGENGYVQFWQEYSEWFGEYNWQNFTLIQVAYENEGMINHREITLGLLGLRIRILWSHGAETETMTMIKGRMADIKAHPEAAISLDDILNGEFREERSTSQRDLKP